MTESYYLCFDIGGTNVKYGVLNALGSFVTQGHYSTNKSSKKTFIQDITNKVNEITSTYAIKRIGISFPGFINVDTGYAEFAGAIDVLHGENILALLYENITLPIVIENDANCATLAEKLTGNAKDCDDFICMTIGTGIGGGIFINGKLVNGHTFKAGEFGLMIIDGMVNGYKNMHEIASTSALIHTYKEAKGLNESEKVEGDQVFREALEDRQVKRLLDQWFSYVSFGIFNLAATLNPEKILIGGGISVREDLYEMLEEALLAIPSWQDIRCTIEPCKHHNEAGMIGALYKCIEEENQ
ncbi:ROK family protein [Gracilibacillus marinus]|jgi:beta-glucoside kinase|uniref:ROK family protein n=1 Tax=Gracilibacillus marinus TaxID=630535 RepID=A0ABV8W0N2_9BACI